MNNNDMLQKFLFAEAPVRGALVHLSESYKMIVEQHPYPPIIRQLLGEALAVVSLLSALIKFDGRLTIQFKGQGKLKLLIVQCSAELHLRGLVQYAGECTPAELADTLSQGILAIIMAPSVTGGKRYQGIVPWQGQSFAQAIEGYFRQSEQLATRIWLAVDETRAAGLLLQALPKDQPELYENDWEHFVHLTQTLTSEELLTLSNQTLLQRLYAEENIRLFPPASVAFRCTCSIPRSENAVLLLGQAEAEQELQHKQKIVVTCEFCNKECIFDRVDVARIFKKDEGNFPLSDQLH
jgi:molecular chaperone Hsp33